MKPSIASLYQAVQLIQEIPPLIIGERANPNGSKKFREYLLADDYDGCLAMALEQEERGAHVIDLCAAYAGRDEKKDLTKLVKRFSASVRAGLMLDSTTPECIEECLKIYPGRMIINSINLEDGGKNLNRICTMAKKYGAVLVALTIDEEGMAMTAERKVAVAKRIYTLATEKYGLRPQDLLFDPLTFTVASGDESLLDAAHTTLDAIRRIKVELPGVLTSLGVSNVSFGLSPPLRRILNSVFLHEAVKAGLDAAIVDAGKIVPYASIPEEERELCLDLLYNRGEGKEESPLSAIIRHFEKREDHEERDEEDDEGKTPEELLAGKLLSGDKEGLEDILLILLRRYPAMDIINQLLVPAMREVGVLFGKGEMLLPFVLKSAEVMKASVTLLTPYMERKYEEGRRSILLATVQGDVHDIGKNLVDIILSNNGYQVHNLGIKVPAEVIIEKARELNVDVIGLSGLLVKSAIVMKESMPQYREAGLTVPILLGGAALTRKFVAESCVPEYRGTVVYCKDAFEGLSAMREHEKGTLLPSSYDPSREAQGAKPGRKDTAISRDNPIPDPPFTGPRYVTEIDPETLFPYLNVEAMFRGRWGYRRGKMGKEEYEGLIENEVKPMFNELKERVLREGLVAPKVAYGYFPCNSEGNTLVVSGCRESFTFTFPRQELPPYLCIADYFKTKEEGEDVAGFFIVTLGDRVSEAIKALYERDSYHDYVIFHGFSVELTDALAEYWHEEMRREMGIEKARAESSHDYVVQKYQGSRYGFGYPACPDLGAHEALFKILEPEKVGITLTENMMMVPELSTSAIVAHHPQAKYFAV